MRRVTALSRRRFGQGLAGCLALAVPPHRARAHDGPHEVEVGIAAFVFAPPRLEIAAGDTVVWVNGDLVPHTATATDGAWDTGSIACGATGRITFDRPGEYGYLCAFHPHMTGTVTVRGRRHG